MDNQRIAEWLSTDVPLGKDRLDRDPIDEDLPIDEHLPIDEDQAEDGASSPQRPADVGEGREGRRAPATAIGASATARRLRLPAVLGFEGQEARILELIAVLGRRIRRRPLASLAVGVGIGFVVGGALSFRVGRLLLAAGARRAGRELLKQFL